jgi:hypothetical protein
MELTSLISGQRLLARHSQDLEHADTEAIYKKLGACCQSGRNISKQGQEQIET